MDGGSPEVGETKQKRKEKERQTDGQINPQKDTKNQKTKKYVGR
jgi:hypothetical protein